MKEGMFGAWLWDGTDQADNAWLRATIVTIAACETGNGRYPGATPTNIFNIKYSSSDPFAIGYVEKLTFEYTEVKGVKVRTQVMAKFADYRSIDDAIKAVRRLILLRNAQAGGKYLAGQGPAPSDLPQAERGAKMDQIFAWLATWYATHPDYQARLRYQYIHIRTALSGTTADAFP